MKILRKASLFVPLLSLVACAINDEPTTQVDYETFKDRAYEMEKSDTHNYTKVKLIYITEEEDREAIYDLIKVDGVYHFAIDPQSDESWTLTIFQLLHKNEEVMIEEEMTPEEYYERTVFYADTKGFKTSSTLHEHSYGVYDTYIYDYVFKPNGYISKLRDYAINDDNSKELVWGVDFSFSE